jgi:hypothetical protein
MSVRTKSFSKHCTAGLNGFRPMMLASSRGDASPAELAVAWKTSEAIAQSKADGAAAGHPG